MVRLLLLSAMLISGCQSAETKRACADVSKEFSSAINSAGECADAILATDGDPTVDVLDGCIERHQTAIRLTAEAENACSDRPELLPNIRGTHENLQHTVQTLDLNRRVLKGEVDPGTALQEMMKRQE